MHTASELACATALMQHGSCRAPGPTCCCGSLLQSILLLQDGFQQLLCDPRFTRALAALRLLVRHHLPLVKQLFAWRQTAHANVAKMSDKTERDRNIFFTKRVR